MRHGRRALVLMSAEHYDWMRAAGQRAHRTRNATTVERLDPEQAALDELLE